MNSGQIFSIVLISLIVIGLIVFVALNQRNKKIVLNNSEKIKKLIELNKTINFVKTQSYYSNHYVCNSKRQLDNLSMTNYLITLISENSSSYEKNILTIENNIRKYNEYMDNVRKIKSTITENYCKSIKINYSIFIDYENRLYNKYILCKPKTDLTIYCKATYTSPKGRNCYKKDRLFNYDEVKRLYKYTIDLQEQMQTRQDQIKLERSMMTDSLRYDIMKRDGFRCQICGSTAQDGVKLHIDHIVPVSKGGRTIPSNLRTLCDRCNIGKSNKT